MSVDLKSSKTTSKWPNRPLWDSERTQVRDAFDIFTKSVGKVPKNDADIGYKHSGGKTYLVRGQQILLDVDRFGLRGRHNRQNVAAAVAIGSVRYP